MKKTIKFANFCGAALMMASIGTSFIASGNSHIVKADADSMAQAPGGTSTSGVKMSGDYVFAPKVMPGITKTWAFGSNAKWSMTGNGNYLLDYTDPGSIASKGKMGVYYQNVGQYDGHTVDVRLTITDYKFDNYKELDDIDGGTRKRMRVFGDKIGMDQPSSDVGTTFKYKVDYLDSKTKQPLKLRGQYSFNDLDMNQGIYLDPDTTSHITNTYYTKDTKLSYKKVGGQMLVYNRHFQAYKGDDSATPEDPDHPSYTPDYINHDETWLPHNFTITYDNAASLTFVWGWPYGGTGNKSTNESKFPGRDFTINGLDKAFWTNPAYSANLSSDLTSSNPENDRKTITTQVAEPGDGGAFLELNAQAVLPEKPQAPKKYVSDSDEGTDNVSEIGLEKSVDHNMLKDRYEKYHYQIVQNVPDVQNVFHYSSYEISDQIDKVLNTSNVHVYNRENQDVTYRFTVTKDDDNKMHVIAKPSSLQQGDFYNETYKVTYDAEIKPGVSLADHKDPKHPDQAVIKNTPEVTIDHDTVKGNTTTTNVQFTHPDPQKSVSNDGNGNGTSLNVDFGKEYKYRVDATAPDNEDIKSFSIEDKLEDVLDLKDVKVYDYDDKDSAGNPRDITKEGKLSTDKNDIIWTATTPSKWHGKHIKMIIGATVKNNADLVKYLNKDNKLEIPNKATVKINDNPKTTNTVNVTPNTPDASVSKKIEVTDDNTGQQIDSSDLNKQENKEDQSAKETSSSTEKKSILTNMINLFGLFNLKK